MFAMKTTIVGLLFTAGKTSSGDVIVPKAKQKKYILLHEWYRPTCTIF